MLLYILKSATCLAILLAFYKIFLERENMHTFKRFYLLGSLLAAFTIPFITFVAYVEIPVVTNIIEQSNSNVPLISSVGQEQFPKNYLPTILWSIYGIGIVVFGFNFIKNLFQIIQRIQKNPKYKINRITNVLLLDRIIPHTFFNYIFLNKHKFEAKEIPSEVLLHEETHAKQKHSLDVLFIEFMQVLFWFNPLMYFMKKAIKLNHEFLADREVLDHGIIPSLYQSILLEFSSSSLQPQLANSINYSSIKKRFTVMKTKTSKKGILIRSLLLLTLLSTLVYGFSQKKILETYPESPQTIIGTWIDEEQELSELSIFEQDGDLMSAHVDSEVFRLQEINGEYYYFSLYEKTKHPVLIDKKKGTLTLANREYVRKEKSLKGKLYGKWENKKEGVKFIVSHSGNEIVWDVIKADGKPTRYYPKKLDGRYAFTYGKEHELWSFKTENGILYDSRGQSYNRVQELQSEEIIVKINKNGQLLVQEKNRVALEDLKGFLLKFNTHLSKEQRSNIVRAVIMPDADAPTGVINKVDAILSDYGVAQIDIIGPVKYSKPRRQLIVQKGATKEQIAEYNALAKKYNAQPINERIIKKKEIERLEYIYKLMTDKQKKKAESFPECPPPPPAPKAIKGEASNIPPPPAPAPVIATKTIKAINDRKNNIPPPPPAPKAIKGEVSTIPPPPAPAPVIATKTIKAINDRKNNIPPPPPAPKAIKGEVSTIPPNAPVVRIGEVSDIPPPPSPTDLNEVANADKIIEEIIVHQDPYDGLIVNKKVIREIIDGKEIITVSPYTPPPSTAPVIHKGDKSAIPPPPPKSPMDHVVEMAKKDAVFYYEGKKISSDKAIAILKKNKKINLRTRQKGLIKPIVELSTKPIITKN